MAKLFDAFRGHRPEHRLVPVAAVDPDAGGGIQTLILVSASAWQLPGMIGTDDLVTSAGVRVTRAQPTGHRGLLAALVGQGLPGKGWVGWLRDGAETDRWIDDRSAAQTCDEIVGETLRIAGEVCESATPDRYNDALVGLRHRVYLDQQRFEAVTGGSGIGVDGFVVILDVRLFQLSGEIGCHISRSVWATPPKGRMFRPEDAPSHRSGGQSIPDLPKYRDAFIEADRRIVALLGRYLIPRVLWVFDRSYDLPQFWVPVPASAPRGGEETDAPETYLSGDRLVQVNTLARLFIDVFDVRDTAVAGGTVNGQLLVFRRFRRRNGSSRPLYLIIPVRALDPRQLAKEQLVASAIATLTDVEATGVTELQWTLDDLATWRNQVRLFSAVAEHAAILWDAVASHLPVRRLRQLDRAHRVVELIHQVLLHGVADLGHLRGLTVECQTRVADTARNLAVRFDEELTERPVSPSTGLRPALTSSGLFAEVTAHAAEVTAEANRVAGNYNQLLQSIGNAFDERRVRESDALQKGSVLFAISMAFVGLITILDALVQLKPEGDHAKPTAFGGADWLSKLGAVGGIGLGILLVGTVAVAGVLVLRLGKLGSAEFRDLYNGRLGKRHRRNASGCNSVWQYLRLASTDTLDSRLRALSGPGTDIPCASVLKAWDAIDQDLATRFATIWDEIRRAERLPPGERLGERQGEEPGEEPGERRGQLRGTARADAVRLANEDIALLARKTERWAVQALLLSERAWRLHRYVLPRLTCLYRCSGKLDWTFVSLLSEVDRIPTMSDTDFNRNMYRLGFTWAEAQRIDTWLEQHKGTMGQLLVRLKDLGLEANMRDPEHRKEFLGKLTGLGRAA